jgi:hypothetical protein
VTIGATKKFELPLRPIAYLQIKGLTFWFAGMKKRK